MTRRAFTLVEAVVGALVLVIVFSGGWQILVASLRGVHHGQETTDQTQLAAVVFRQLAFDLGGILPRQVPTGDATMGGDAILFPDDQNATSIEFWTVAEDTPKLVSYLFDPNRPANGVRREVTKNGTVEHSHTFGSGTLRWKQFQVKAIPGPTLRWKVTLTFEGKLKQSSYSRVFASPRAPAGTFQDWVHEKK